MMYVVDDAVPDRLALLFIVLRNWFEPANVDMTVCVFYAFTRFVSICARASTPRHCDIARTS